MLPPLETLIERLKLVYGAAYTPYGTSEHEEDGTGFRVEGIGATFSVVWSAEGKYDVQVESYPPGDYLYHNCLAFDDFISLIEAFRAPLDTWPNQALKRDAPKIAL